MSRIQRPAAVVLSRAFAAFLVLALGLFTTALGSSGLSRSVTADEGLHLSSASGPELKSIRSQIVALSRSADERVGHDPLDYDHLVVARHDPLLQSFLTSFLIDSIRRPWSRSAPWEARAPPAV